MDRSQVAADPVAAGAVVADAGGDVAPVVVEASRLAAGLGLAVAELRARLRHCYGVYERGVGGADGRLTVHLGARSWAVAIRPDGTVGGAAASAPPGEPRGWLVSLAWPDPGDVRDPAPDHPGLPVGADGKDVPLKTRARDGQPATGVGAGGAGVGGGSLRASWRRSPNGSGRSAGRRPPPGPGCACRPRRRRSRSSPAAEAVARRRRPASRRRGRPAPPPRRRAVRPPGAAPAPGRGRPGTGRRRTAAARARCRPRRSSARCAAAAARRRPPRPAPRRAGPAPRRRRRAASRRSRR